MKLSKDDEIASVKLVKDDDDILISTYHGKCLRINSANIRLFKGRSAKGVKGINIINDDKVISLTVIKKTDIDRNNKIKNLRDKNIEQFILSITNSGYGKRTSSFEFNIKGRGGKGMKVIKINKTNENLAACLSVYENDDVMVITDKGQMLRCNVKTIRASGRDTSGVKILNTSPDERVVSAVRVIDE